MTHIYLILKLIKTRINNKDYDTIVILNDGNERNHNDQDFKYADNKSRDKRSQ